MSYTIGIATEGGYNQVVELDQLPDECPICHIHQLTQQGAVHYHKKRRMIQVVHTCTNNDCGRIFIAYYSSPSGTNSFSLAGLEPWYAEKVVIPPLVAQLSPTYVEIRNQVANADAHRLDQLVGIGLRKALEFLIKDYACSEHPNDIEKIKKTMLSPCINDYINDQNIKKTAERATWLGNDETHYIRKWETKDIKDLKVLIMLTEGWINNLLLTKQYEQEMQK